MNIGVVVAILAIVAILVAKFKSLIFKAKDNVFIKDDERLLQVQKKQEASIDQKKQEIEALKAEELPPDMVEAFWKDKKK